MDYECHIGMGMCSCKERRRNSAPDSVTGLTQTDIRQIRESWRKISRNKLSQPIGIEVFIKLFERQPRTADYFTRLEPNRNPPQGSQSINRHVKVFMDALGQLIEYLDKPRSLVGIANTTAFNHVVRHITDEEMKIFCDLFIESMKDKLGDEVSDASLESWKTFFAFFLTIYKNVHIEVKGIMTMRVSRHNLAMTNLTKRAHSGTKASTASSPGTKISSKRSAHR